jgi:hypothetical protein
MKRLASAAAVVLSCVAPGVPAGAAVLEITTSLAAADADDPVRLRQAVDHAVRTAVDEARQETRTFVPTRVLITRAVTIGERVYVRIVISDDPDTPHASAAPYPNDI